MVPPEELRRPVDTRNSPATASPRGPTTARPSSASRDFSHGGDVDLNANEPNAQNEDEVSDALSASDDEDDIAQGLFGPSSDDEDDETPPQGKRQRLAQLMVKAVQLNGLNKIPEKPGVKKILEDLEELPEYQLPKNRRQRRSMAQGHAKDVGEVYSPARVTKIASDMGLRPAWALDLTTVDPADGLPWDFSSEAKRKRAKELLEADRPLMLIACPMCGHFSTLMNWNYAAMDKEKAEELLKAAMQHLQFALELCLLQYRAGRLFLFEHPVGAHSWGTAMVRQMLELEGVFMSKFDFCCLGMKTIGANGEEAAARKRTTVMTNSKNIADVLRLAQCSGEHKHVPLLDGKAGPCQGYPEKFVKLVCSGILKEIEDIRWKDRVAKKLDITGPVNAPMEFTEKLEEFPVPPHEEDDAARFEMLYEDCEFYDDISGAKLDKKLATAARRTEIDFFKARGVYSKRRREKWMKVISTKRLDQNKGDESRPKYRARLVGREIARERRDDVCAATPPLESLKAIVSLCASRQGRRHAHRLMSIDVKRAYFYAPATRPIFITIPKEDWEEGDEQNVAQLNLSLYGTRDAAMNWTATFTRHLVELGFAVGKCSPCNFSHSARDMAVTVHGDDFTCAGSTADLRWLKSKMEEKYEIACEVLGPEAGQQKEIRVLNRVIRWEDDGLAYEPDQRHAEIVIKDLGLEEAKPVSTPGAREELGKASALCSTGVEAGEESPLLGAKDASAYRGIAARLNYLAQDRADIQYACKEASRRMARPREGDWAMLKRIGRYLVGAPRFVQHFRWQQTPETLDTFTDSDWAGCRSTCRSTSGGAAKFGSHCLKSWSSTQATVALSSAEAELYALTKGAAQALRLMSILADFGVSASATVHTDASAAIGIVRRAGLGKLRHLNVRYLWLQDQVKRDAVQVMKVAGADNPADLMTKNLPAHVMHKHMETLHMDAVEGRAESAPLLSALGILDANQGHCWHVPRRRRQRREPQVSFQ